MKTTFFCCLFFFSFFVSMSIEAQSPSVAAPIPVTRSIAKVTSIYSGAYSNVLGTVFNTTWQQATVFSVVNIAGDATLKYANLDYQGIELGSHVNALPMSHLHLDVWSADETSLKFTPISPNKELLVDLPPLTLNAWNSFDIPLSLFVGVDMSDLIQFKIVGTGGKTVFVDNLYLYDNSATIDVEAPTAFTASSGLVTFNSVELLLNATDNKGAIDYEIKYGATTIHASGVSGVSKLVKIDLLAGSSDFNFSVTARDYTGNTAANSPIVVPVTTYAIAPTPSNPSNKVISIFSDAYTNVVGTIFTPNWQQLTVASIETANSNSVLKYTKLNYQGIELGSHVNSLPMTHLHLDVWTTDETYLDLYIISPNGHESISPLAISNFYSWNGFDIPLSSLTGVVLSDIFQFKIVGTGGKTIYVDNLYFYDDSAEDSMAPTAFTATVGLVTFNSVELLLNALDNRGAINYEIKYGATTLTTTGVSGVTKSYTVDLLAGSTNYNFAVSASDVAGNKAANNPLSADTITYSAAPVPALLAADVISIFSNAYVNIAGTIFTPFWGGQTTVPSIITPNGNAVLKYTNLNFQGVELGSHVDASTMNTIHIDTWCSDLTTLTFLLISPGKECAVALEPLAMNEWNSFDLPLSRFVGVNLSDVFQLKIVGTGGKTVYFDNIYFCNTTDVQLPKAFTATKGVVTFESVELLLNAFDNSGVVNYEITYGATTLNVSGVSGVQKSVVVESLLPSSNYTFSILAKDVAGNAAENNPQIVSATTFVAPSAAPSPTVAALLVESVYSDEYTNISGTEFNGLNGQDSQFSSIALDGNATIKYVNFDFQFITLKESTNIHDMSFLHIDAYTHDLTSLQVSLLSDGVEKKYDLKPLILNSWNSYDVPLFAFVGVDLSAINQIKLVGTGGKTVYLDNLYFYGIATSISDLMVHNDVKLYPNPASNSISLSSSSEVSKVVISNMLGQTIEIFSVIRQDVTLDISTLPVGNYIVTINGTNGLISKQMMIKK